MEENCGRLRNIAFVEVSAELVLAEKLQNLLHCACRNGSRYACDVQFILRAMEEANVVVMADSNGCFPSLSQVMTFSQVIELLLSCPRQSKQIIEVAKDLQSQIETNFTYNFVTNENYSNSLISVENFVLDEALDEKTQNNRGSTSQIDALVLMHSVEALITHSKL